jgi:Fe2+ or Zn2+ uptake regulation protein
MRCTPQRYAVLDWLAGQRRHATAEEIFRAVNRSDPRASRATVYNSLHALVRAGLVREVPLEGNAARFDANVAPHHHFVCDRCGEVEDVDWCGLATTPEPAAVGRRTVNRYEIVFRGICGSCRDKEENQNG